MALATRASADGKSITVRMEDSGPGFDYQRCPVDLAANTTPSGRGIPLVRALCQALTYHGAGNCAEAVYVWSQGEIHVAQRAS